MVPRDTVWPGRGVMVGIRHRDTLNGQLLLLYLGPCRYPARLLLSAAIEALEGVHVKVSISSMWWRQICNDLDNISPIVLVVSLAFKAEPSLAGHYSTG